MKQVRYLKNIIFLCMFISGIAAFSRLLIAQTPEIAQQEDDTTETSDDTIEAESPDGEQTPLPNLDQESAIQRPMRNFLFIHDTSKNMRKRKRIAMMQDAIRRLLNNASPDSRAGLYAFGHRFEEDGPDACQDVEAILPVDELQFNREDFDTQLNLLSDPPLGGGAPIGLALSQGIDALRNLTEPKEVTLFGVDLQECKKDDIVGVLQTACQVPNLHVTLVGIGLRRDLQVLQEAGIDKLACVDIINVTTNEEGEELPNSLLTRLSIQFKNAEDQLLDPAPGGDLLLTLALADNQRKPVVVRQKVKNADMKGESIETVGLSEGTYLLDLSYGGHDIRAKKEIVIGNRQEVVEIIRLGKMLVDVTDFSGGAIADTMSKDMEITLFDADKPIRSASGTTNTEFDLLPGDQYKIQVTYTVGGKRQTVESQELISIREGNHQNVTIALPVGSLSGRIVDMQGVPVSKAGVTLTEVEAKGGQKASPQSLTADEQGNFFFPDVASGDYTLTLSTKGYERRGPEFTLIGGKINELGDVQLFQGIETSVTSSSGKSLDDATVTIVEKATGISIPVSRFGNVYRNAALIPDGEYTVSVEHPDHQGASRDVTYQKKDLVVDAAFTIPYYVTVVGNVVNTRGDALPDARMLSQNTRAVVAPLPGEKFAYGDAEGKIRARLAVSSGGEEQLSIVWNDAYNQSYRKDITAIMPNAPQEINIGTLVISMNFLTLALTNIVGEPINADSILLTHQQTGQSGIRLNAQTAGHYESAPLLDGDYTMRVMKQGYQDVEQQISLQGGETKGTEVTLHNYVTVQGTLVDAKQNRIPDAVVTFQQAHGKLTTQLPVITGKDGRFQTTLLAEGVGQETFSIIWKSPGSGNEYQAAGSFELSKEPIHKFLPLELGMYELPANFIRLEVRDVSGRGLPGADVQFISRSGVAAKSVELGNGMYESLDLADGTYNITVNKAGYKENIIVPDISVGKDHRQADAGHVALPHYATITGTILNGKDEGVPNVELFLGGEHSEQLEQCRTDQAGRFSTVILVNGTGRETWKASWQGEKFVTQGAFDLPAQPKVTTNIGEARLPVNFVTIPMYDIRGEALTGVDVQIRARQASGEAESLKIEEIEPGVYQAQHLPDGDYAFSFAKEGFETGRTLDVNVSGGMHSTVQPVRLGYYVTVNGVIFNGKMEPVNHAAIRAKGLSSTLLLPQPAESQEEPPVEPTPAQTPEPSATLEQPELPLLHSDEHGAFTAQFLVTSPEKEQLEISWDGKFTTLFDVDFTNGPEQQRPTFKLPINFVTVQVSDISKKPLSGAVVTIENDLQEEAFTLQETASGSYQSEGIPDGSYTISVSKENYQTTTRLLEVQFGEQQGVACQLNHYITVKGHVLDGKRDGVSAALIAFAESKALAEDKVISGTDGAFEARLLVRDIGRESGEISWQGKHGTFRKSFWLDLPVEPKEIALSDDQTLLPINYLSLELKSVAATGIPGATVKLRHLASGSVIEARDNDNGNYEGEELFDGLYDIEISKEQYQPITLSNISLSGGEHERDVIVPKFLHHITISGVVVNGKSQGVRDALVSIRSPKKLQNCEPFRTREDGSFTLEALVTDVGSETLDVTWNDTYTTSLPIKLPFLPEQVKLDAIRLPINFISVRIVDIYNQPISDAAVSFSPKQGDNMTAESLYGGQEADAGTYKSPELPNQSYLVVVQKEGYHQQEYPEIAVKDGQLVSNLAIELRHVVTLKGRVTDGKGRGVPHAIVNLDQKATLQSAAVIETDAAGNFATHVQVTGSGEDVLNVAYRVRNESNRPLFELLKKFIPLNQPGEQDFGELRLPINFIPAQMYDVIGRPIEHAEVAIVPSNGENDSINGSAPIEIAYTGEGKYEGEYVKDGTYKLLVTKEGYQSQQAEVTVAGGQVAAETSFTMPHYVTLSGMVVEGKRNGVANALIEFGSAENLILSAAEAQDVALTTPVTTDIRGQFRVKMLVKKAGTQQAKAIWNNAYVKDFSFLLPDTPDSNLSLSEAVRLPINFAPFRMTNILGQGLSGVDIQLRQEKADSESNLLANPLGNGLYEARELLDGTYAVNVRKDGYQEMTGTFSVKEGETSPEQRFALPHYVTVLGSVVNGKGEGVKGATITLSGSSSSLLRPEEAILTGDDGSFRADVLVTGSSGNPLKETLKVAWSDSASSGKTLFELTHEFLLPELPQLINVGMLALPANFYDVAVNDIAGRGLSGVKVTFTDEQAREFAAQEINSGLYEGQNLPNGTYVVSVSKEGYQPTQRESVVVTDAAENAAEERAAPLTFALPYYVKIQGTAVDGKGQQIASDIALSLLGGHGHLIADSVAIDEAGNFSADVLVNKQGTEVINLSWTGEHGDYVRSLPFTLPSTPKTVDFQRVTLPINFIPIDVRNLSGAGVTEAAVTLSHIQSGQEIAAKEIGNGMYEGQLLLDGGYEIGVAKDGYKASERVRVNVANGIVSETVGFRLRHYVWITGVATNGNGKGVNDPIIELDQERSIERLKRSDLTGKFEVQLEVSEIGNERMQVSWKNKYRLPVVFELPEKPESHDLGDIRLPINFISFVVTDVSGSTLPDVTVKIESVPSGLAQRFKTDQNGFCKSDDLPNGQYQITVSKSGYQEERRVVNIRDGNHVALHFTLPHYVTIKGTIKDILQQPVGNANVIFEEFFDSNQQKLRTVSNPVSGQFEQRLLIDDARFLERQKGHFVVEKDGIRDMFTFKIPTQPNQIITYTTLLFPVSYLYGKVVDKDVRTIPLSDAQITLTPVSDLLYKDTAGIAETDESAGASQPLKIVTDSLGAFKLSSLPNGEYKIVIEKDGYATYEDFLRISGLLQEQEFALRKE